MRRLRVFLYVSTVTVLFASVWGCTRKEDKPQAKNESVVIFTHVLSAWDTGDKEEAINKFLQINWDESAALADLSVLHTSEEQFKALSHDKQMRYMQDAKELSTKLRKIGLHILTAGENALSSGDKRSARAHYEAVLECGQAILSEDRFELIQLTAEGLTKAAKDRIAAVKWEEN